MSSGGERSHAAAGSQVEAPVKGPDFRRALGTWSWLAAASVLLALAACESTALAQGGALGTAPGALGELVADAKCETDGQCRTIGIGAKPCGGAEAYLAWSTLRTDGQALRALVERDAQIAMKKGRSEDRLLSDCQVVVDPGAYCAVTGSSSGASASPPAKACRLRPLQPGAGAPAL
jgi:hypothetical protein